MLLEGIPEREAALCHMEAALKPGGWLAVEEVDYINWLPGNRRFAGANPHLGEIVEKRIA
jgi:hypothetical protein